MNLPTPGPWVIHGKEVRNINGTPIARVISPKDAVHIAATPATEIILRAVRAAIRMEMQRRPLSRELRMCGQVIGAMLRWKNGTVSDQELTEWMDELANEFDCKEVWQKKRTEAPLRVKWEPDEDSLFRPLESKLRARDTGLSDAESSEQEKYGTEMDIIIGFLYANAHRAWHTNQIHRRIGIAISKVTLRQLLYGYAARGLIVNTGRGHFAAARPDHELTDTVERVSPLLQPKGTEIGGDADPVGTDGTTGD